MPIVDTKHLTEESMQNYLNNHRNDINNSLQCEVEDLLLWRRTHGVNKIRDFLPSIQNDSLRELIDSLVNHDSVYRNGNDYYADIEDKLEEIESMQQDVRDEIYAIREMMKEQRGIR